MIENARQYEITKAAAEKFVNALAEFDNGPIDDTEVHPLIRKAQRDGMSSQLADLRSQMEEYDSKRQSQS